jgi:15-cis-phytoene synthase
VSTPEQVAAAYRHCEAVTRAQAANFFYGIRLLPGERRRAMSAVYAFARRIDDIGDGTLAREEKLRLLDGEVRALASIGLAADAEASDLAAGTDLVIVALADARRRFPLPADALVELIEGVRMDVSGATYEDFEQLVVYCRRVAGGIGRLCLAIFGLREDARADAADAERLADELGVALQLTNILRDVREDAENGRVYLPAEDLRRFGVLSEGDFAQANEPRAREVLATLDEVVAGADANGADANGASADARRREQLVALVRFESERAQQWFDRGIALTAMLDRRSAACVLAMAGIYRRLLDRIDAQPGEVARRRMSLPAREKAWVAARGMLGVGA